MRRRANSPRKVQPSSENQTVSIEMSKTTKKTRASLSMSPLLTRKRRTFSEMERGSSTSSASASAASAIAAAAEKVAVSMACDVVCGTSGNSEDKENDPSITDPQQKQSPHQEYEKKLQRPQLQIQKQQHTPLMGAGTSSSSFPHIDVNIDANMNIDVTVNIENLDFDFDFHALPVEIQMALEDTLLGWTHLTSITLGHILLPWLAFYTVKRASKYVLETTVYTMVLQGTPATISTAAALEGGVELHAVEAVLVSPTTHVILGAVAAIAAFRLIRNRRRVWFRHAYGSKAYNQCQEGRRRRQMVLEADQRKTSLLSLTSNQGNVNYASPTKTWTSEVLTNFKRKRHRKKLQRASDRFARHHTLSPKRKDTITSRQKLRHGNELDFSTTTSVASTVDECYDSSSSDEWDDVCSGPGDRKKQTSASHRQDTTGNPDSNGTCVSSIAHDAVCIPRIHNVPYAHGGFFGAAPFFLADQFWVDILRELLPDVYVEISRRVGGGSGLYFNSSRLRIRKGSGNHDNYYRSDASKLIHWAENNPVVAAYGVVVDLQLKQQLAAESRSKTTNASANVTKENPEENSKDNDSFSKSGSSGNIIDHFYQNSMKNKSNDLDRHTDPLSTYMATTQPDGGTENMVIPNLEWDIFVDPQLVRRVEAVLDSIDRYIASKKNLNTNSTKKTDDSAGKRTNYHPGSMSSCCGDGCDFCEDINDVDNEDHLDLIDEDSGKSEAAALLADHDHNNTTSCNSLLNMNVNLNNLCGNGATNICCDDFQSTSVPSNPSCRNGNSSRGQTQNNNNGNIGRDFLKNDPVLRYLERELEKRTQVLADRLLIAHGNAVQIITEQAGVLKDWNYSRVKRTRRTLGGGMYARQWMAVFSEALRLGMKPSSRNSGVDKGKQACRANGVDETDDNTEEEDEHYNFYDEDEYESEESEAMVSPRRREEETKDPVEDDRNHCTCSPRCCLNTTLAESLRMIEQITQTKQPVGILLDLKSRHVPKRVLSLLISCLEKTGIRVVGIASFYVSDIRGVCNNDNDSNSSSDNPRFDFYNQYENENDPVLTNKNNGVMSPTEGIGTRVSFKHRPKEILMFHSAGDLQAGCDEGLVQPGDHVFFNGGSLILDSARSSTLKTLLGFFFDMCVCGYYSTFDPCAIEDGYRIQSYGYACSSMDAVENAACFAKESADFINGNDNNATTMLKKLDGLQHRVNYPKDGYKDTDEDTLLVSSSSEDTDMGAVMKTLADYKKHYGFSMGLYLQEFSIDEAAAKLLINLVNQSPKLYDLGLAWGGINGMTVHGIQPGRFTSTDGYWVQRRLGLNWKDPF